MSNFPSGMDYAALDDSFLRVCDDRDKWKARAESAERALAASRDDAFVAVPKSDINDLLEYFEQREDASNEGDGWRGNEEMGFAQRLRELIGEKR